MISETFKFKIYYKHFLENEETKKSPRGYLSLTNLVNIDTGESVLGKFEAGRAGAAIRTLLILTELLALVRSVQTLIGVTTRLPVQNQFKTL